MLRGIAQKKYMASLRCIEGVLFAPDVYNELFSEFSLYAAQNLSSLSQNPEAFGPLHEQFL